MEDFSSSGDWTRIEIDCPKCNSTNVSIIIDEFGYYRVAECYRCGYRLKEINA